MGNRTHVFTALFDSPIILPFEKESIMGKTFRQERSVDERKDHRDQLAQIKRQLDKKKKSQVSQPEVLEEVVVVETPQRHQQTGFGKPQNQPQHQTQPQKEKTMSNVNQPTIDIDTLAAQLQAGISQVIITNNASQDAKFDNKLSSAMAEVGTKIASMDAMIESINQRNAAAQAAAAIKDATCAQVALESSSEKEEEGWSTTTKVLVGVGAAVAVGAVGYWVYNKYFKEDSDE